MELTIIVILVLLLVFLGLKHLSLYVNLMTFIYWTQKHNLGEPSELEFRACRKEVISQMFS